MNKTFWSFVLTYVALMASLLILASIMRWPR